MKFALASLVALILGCHSASPVTKAPSSKPSAPISSASSQDAITVAVSSMARPAEDRERDADRKPILVMNFLGVKEGAKIADLMSGRGYYAELFARVVGPTGHVYAQNNAFVVQKFADAPLRERLERLGMGHITRLDTELEDPRLPKGQLDIAHIGSFYHDTYWQHVDRAKMNRAVWDALKPGGIFVVVDHRAEDGSKDRDVKTIHRVDAELVKSEVLAAGFEWAGESDALSNPDDNRSKNVFEDDIRGKTDRFIFKFRKPTL